MNFTEVMNDSMQGYLEGILIGVGIFLIGISIWISYILLSKPRKT